MRWLIPRSEVCTDAGGWIWLQPVQRSTRRHTDGTFAGPGAGSRIAMSDFGLFVQDGVRTAQVGWSAVVGVQAAVRTGRWRIRIDDGYRPRTTRTAFEPEVARQWLALVTAEADRRGLAPVVLADGVGFTSGS